jgi:hypothetical protein
MTRIKFNPTKTAKGSQKWLQHMAEHRPDLLQPAGLPKLEWLSPRANDDYAEYMDAAFLDRLELGHLAAALPEFWPVSGPRWDGLARAGSKVVLVEAKAHLKEATSTPSAASSDDSIKLIARSLNHVKTALKADDRSDWTRCFYQYANRLAHLWWLREQKVDAHLLLVGFLNDAEVGGPASADGWKGVYIAINHALGLSQAHSLAGYIHHVHPDVNACRSDMPA